MFLKTVEAWRLHTGTYPRKLFSPLLSQQHRDFLAPQVSAPTQNLICQKSHH